MGDVFLECLVKKKVTPAFMALKVLYFTLGIIIFMVSFMFIGSQFFGPFALLVGVGAIYFAWYLSTSLNVEFEYIFTNGEIDVDKIMAKRKRKRLVTVKVSGFNEFDVYKPAAHDLSKYEVKYDVAVAPNEEGTYYATFSNKEGKRCILIFTPDERVLTAINSIYRRRVHAQ